MELFLEIILYIMLLLAGILAALAGFTGYWILLVPSLICVAVAIFVMWVGIR